MLLPDKHPVHSGNGNATIDNSTVFLDYVGPLGGASVATWTNSSANKAVNQTMARVQAAVRKGFMARVAADWQVTPGSVRIFRHFLLCRFACLTLVRGSQAGLYLLVLQLMVASACFTDVGIR